ncbi:MAG: hypothetical protein GX452_04450 [Ignavibacteriales bacterium]|nr:hypothetical protein [Ignavibacteriales bacterium]
MSKTTLTVQQIVPAGTEITLAAANADGSNFINNGRTFLIVKNDSGVSVDVTILSRKQCDQGYTHNQVDTIPAGKTKYLGFFNTDRFNLSGYADITFSAVDNVSIAAVTT